MLGLLSLLGGLIALMLVKDLIWLLRSFKYIRQRIPTKYFPFVGFAKYLDNPQKENGLEDFFELFQNPKNPNQTEKLILMNGLSTEPTIFLNDKDLVKQFFQKETEVSYTANVINFLAKEIFLFSKDAHGVQKDRAIFAELFFPENLEKQTPRIRVIIQNHLDRIKIAVKKGSKSQGTRHVEIDLKPYFKNLYSDLVSFVLFGGEVPDVDGVMLIEQIDRVIDGSHKNFISFLNIATLGLSTKLGLDSEYNKTKRLYNRIIKKLKEVVKERETSKTYKFGCNAVDLLILKNRELEAQGKGEETISYDKIAASIFSIIFAGTDTTRKLTESSLYMLSSKPQLQQEMREAIRRDVLGTGSGSEYQDYVNSPLLEAFMKESLRVHTPALMTFHRKITKTFKLIS